MTKVESRKSVKPKNRPTVKEYLTGRLKNVPLTILMSLFAALCIGSLIYFAILGGARVRDCFICLAFLAVVPVFYFAEYTLNVRAPLGYTIFMLVFVLFCFLGACYNLYYIIPCLDDVLHAAWGVVFSVIGIILIKALLGAPKTAKGVIAYVLFGVGFAMLMSIAWEIYEYSGDCLIADMDMQQDTIVNRIHSFIMFPDPAHPNPDNLHTWQVEDIAYTIMYDAAGNEIGRIPNGYLDLGLTDTMHDIIWCLVTTVVFSVILAVDWCKGKYLYRFIIPALRGEKYDKKGVLIETADGGGVTAAEAEAEETEEHSVEETEEETGEVEEKTETEAEAEEIKE